MYTLASDTPVLLANSGIYMFPDTLADTRGSFVGIVLSSELPAADRKTFNDLLAQQVDLRIQVWLCILVFLSFSSKIQNYRQVFQFRQVPFSTPAGAKHLWYEQ